MDLNIRTEAGTPENHNWLGSQHGTDSTEPVTLDGTLLGAIFADGIVPSGVILAKVTATGRYARYDNAQVDGREVAVGALFTSARLRRPEDAAGFKNAQAALLWHGEIIEAKLPTNHGLDAAGKTDLKHIRFV